MTTYLTKKTTQRTLNITVRSLFTPEHPVKGILKKAKRKGEFQRIQCVWLRALWKMPPNQIAEAIGWSVSRVKQIQGRYFQERAQAFQGPGRGGRRRENLTREEEENLLTEPVNKFEIARWRN